MQLNIRQGIVSGEDWSVKLITRKSMKEFLKDNYNEKITVVDQNSVLTGREIFRLIKRR